MCKLHKRFMDTVKNIGMDGIMRPIFYNAPIGIRFEIGNTSDVYLPNNGEVNPIYIAGALHRAKTIFQNLPNPPDILRLDIYPEETLSPWHVQIENLSPFGLLYPCETLTEKFIDDSNSYTQQHLYWDLNKSSIQLDVLLLNIIIGELGGVAGLCSNVYFVNTHDMLLFHLYDDRGADIVAQNKKTLFPLYQKFHEWILDYDREQIEQLFAE